MSKIPKISIIIPVYNTGKYLEKCLDSLTSQSLKHIEYIFVNDGSTDNSAEILEKYANLDKRIKVINEVNRGPSKARNRGLKCARGEYIGFVDSDDWVSPTMYEELYSKAKEYEADVSICGCDVYYDKEDRTDKNNWYYNLSCFPNSLDNTSFSEKDTRSFTFSIAVSPCNKIYKKSYLEKNKILFPENLHFEDNAFFFNIYLNGALTVLVRKNLYIRRWGRRGSITESADEKYFDLFKVLEILDNIVASAGQFNNYQYSLIDFKILGLVNRLILINHRHKKSYFKEVKEYLGTLGLKETDFERLYPNNVRLYKFVMTSKNYMSFYVRNNLDKMRGK